MENSGNKTIKIRHSLLMFWVILLVCFSFFTKTCANSLII